MRLTRSMTLTLYDFKIVSIYSSWFWVKCTQ